MAPAAKCMTRCEPTCATFLSLPAVGFLGPNSAAAIGPSPRELPAPTFEYESGTSVWQPSACLDLARRSGQRHAGELAFTAGIERRERRALDWRLSCRTGSGYGRLDGNRTGRTTLARRVGHGRGQSHVDIANSQHWFDPPAGTDTVHCRVDRTLLYRVKNDHPVRVMQFSDLPISVC
jgi:hypothetical protein